jgi:hypothetical protein
VAVKAVAVVAVVVVVVVVVVIMVAGTTDMKLAAGEKRVGLCRIASATIMPSQF